MRELKNGILIDMRPIKHMRFDPSKLEVTVGGGVITDDFAHFLQQNGVEVSM